MKTNDNKRYLITYTDGKIGSAAASSILGLTKGKMKDGVKFMATDAVPGKEDVMHFENVGVTSIQLTEEEAKTLSGKKGILAVEEDLEMHALVMPEDQVFQSGGEFAPQANEAANYSDGYNKAVLDVMNYLLKSEKPESNTQGLIPPQIIIPRLFQPIPWNITRVNAPLAWSRGINGKGVNVAVLDTGIAAHPDLVISGGVSFVSGVASYNDGHGHGTHCAGVIGARNNFIGVVGVAPLSNLYAVKVLADTGSGLSSWIIAGMEWCITHGIKVISMSLGAVTGPSVAYATAVKHCQDSGITVVMASGNSYGSSFPYVNQPANSFTHGSAYPNNERPIAVGAIDNLNVIASFSSRGGATPDWNQVTVVAPGVNIYSTYKGGGYATMSGTSMATPHVAGCAALVCQRYPGITPVNVKSRIASTAIPLGGGHNVTYGYGLINCNAATL
ncbi:MAG: S8 family peptidase [Bacteroidota bacterium]